MMFSKYLVAVVAFTGLSPLVLAQPDYAVGETFSDKLRSGANGPEMVVIKAGRFVLGGRRVSKDQLGLINIDYQLAFGATEVTRGQYREFLTATQSGNLHKLPKGNDDLPVTNVSWDDTDAYVSWLSRQTGRYYRLPSSSEWEYAARAGSRTSYYWGDEVGDNMANCLNCKTKYRGKLAPVGSFSANPWGLYDMHGNVWEWTKDCIDPNSAPSPDGAPQLFGNCAMRELRGGSAKSDAWSMRSSARASAPRTIHDNDVGFRVVMDIP